MTIDRASDETTPARAAALAVSWLLLIGGAAAFSALAAAEDLADADRARVRHETAAAERDAVANDLASWRAIGQALRTSPAFRGEWARREVGPLLPQPTGLRVDAALRVDPRRPEPTVVEPVEPARWRPTAERLASPSRLRTGLLVGSVLLMLIGTVAPTRAIYATDGLRRWLRRRYRIDRPHDLDGPHAASDPATAGDAQ